MPNIFQEAADWIGAELHAVWTAISHANATTITTAVAQDAQLVGAGLKDALAAFTAITGTDTTAAQKLVSEIIAGVETVTAGVQTNLAKPALEQVAADWATLQTTIAPILSSLPAAVVSVLNAVTTILPYITAAAGLVSTKVAAASEASGLTPAEARVILAAAGK